MIEFLAEVDAVTFKKPDRDARIVLLVSGQFAATVASLQAVMGDHNVKVRIEKEG